MNKITCDDVRKVAKLARLDLPEVEVEIYTTQLEQILGYVAQLEKVDTSKVMPTTRAVEVVNRVRKDEIVNPKLREKLLDQAPQREGEFYRVPKILSE